MNPLDVSDETRARITKTLCNLAASTAEYLSPRTEILLVTFERPFATMIKGKHELAEVTEMTRDELLASAKDDAEALEDITRVTRDAGPEQLVVLGVDPEGVCISIVHLRAPVTSPGGAA